jgi:LPS-assembly protein
LKPLSALLTCLTLAVPAMAQEPVSVGAGGAAAGPLAEGAPLVLKPSALLQEQIPGHQRRDLPVFIQADRISGRADAETRLEGGAVMRRGDTVIRADQIEFNQAQDSLRAQGNVRINRAGNRFEGPLLEMQIDTFEGFFTEPRFQFLRNQAHGEARRIDFIDDSRAVIHQTSFTTCERKPGPSWLPDWVLKAQRMEVNNELNEARAVGATVEFKGVPVLPVPSVTFPMSPERRSGLLPPTVGVDNIGGVEYSQPYYWDIAPNRDLTLHNTLWSKRGVNVGAEFRYLESVQPDYRGQFRLDYMPNDLLRERSRWGLAQSHQGWFDVGPERVNMTLNLNRVSDDNYWRDFTRMSPTLTQRILPSDLQLAWNHGPFTTAFRTLHWQTLQDATAPITPPYDRLPQLNTRYQSPAGQRLDIGVEADYSRFDRSMACVPTTTSTLECQPNAQRVYSQARVAYPMAFALGTVTPKLMMHARSYQFDAPLQGSGAQVGTGPTTASVAVPTFSLDAVSVLERSASWGGREMVQTLEPRIFYVNTPYRDQSRLPVYDSGRYDYNFATVYTENAFVGNDRIADNKLVTLGATSRFIDPATGIEAARFGLAQRVRLKDQNVLMPTETEPVSERLSDVLAGAMVQISPAWQVDSTVQYNPKTARSMRTTAGMRYIPGNYRLLTAAYRYQVDPVTQQTSELIDTAWQWPLKALWGAAGRDMGPGRGLGEDQWYAVGRLNYNLSEGKAVDAVLGVEYDAGCWIGRVVFERLQVATNQANQRLMFQLEFSGFARVGPNPLGTLKTQIPRYQYLRDQVSAPSRFGQYD